MAELYGKYGSATEKHPDSSTSSIGVRRRDFGIAEERGCGDTAKKARLDVDISMVQTSVSLAS